MAADHYEVLGVSRTATPDDVKRAYRRLARESHPDANRDDPGAEERFKSITHAYEVLSDPSKRERYDTFGDERVAGAGGFSDLGDFGNISDLFSAFFGGAGTSRTQRRGPSRGSDVLAEVELTLEDAAAGVEREVEVSTLGECTVCAGTGASPGTYPSTCSDCGGTGELRQVRRTMLGNVISATSCLRCGGTGKEIAHPCDKCAGAGRVEVNEMLTVQIPAGVSDGAHLRVSGRGEAGVRGGRSGDLYVGIGIAPHPVFKRAGDDLGCEVVVPMTVATLGGQVEVPTLEDPELIDVSPGTQSGEVVRLRNRGMPRLERGGRGQLIALLKVQIPDDLDQEQADLVRHLADLRGETVGQRGLFEKIKDAFN